MAWSSVDSLLGSNFPAKSVSCCVPDLFIPNIKSRSSSLSESFLSRLEEPTGCHVPPLQPGPFVAQALPQVLLFSRKQQFMPFFY